MEVYCRMLQHFLVCIRSKFAFWYQCQEPRHQSDLECVIRLYQGVNCEEAVGTAAHVSGEVDVPRNILSLLSLG